MVLHDIARHLAPAFGLPIALDVLPLQDDPLGAYDADAAAAALFLSVR